MTKFYPQQPGTKIKTPLSEFYLKDGTVLRARVPSLGEEDENIVGMLEDGRRFVVPMANIGEKRMPILTQSFSIIKNLT